MGNDVLKSENENRKDSAREERKLLTYEEFRVRLLQGIEARPALACHVKRRWIRKNNGVELEGIVIETPDTKEEKIFYLKHGYEDFLHGLSVEELLDQLSHRGLQKAELLEKLFSFYFDYEKVKGRILFRIIALPGNGAFLESVPHRRVLDWAIVYYCKVYSEKEGIGNITVRKEHLSYWGATEEELFFHAMQNTPKLLPVRQMDLEECVGELMERECPDDEKSEPELPGEIWQSEERRPLVLTNDQLFWGAGVVLYEGLLKRIWKQVGRDFFVIPSSIHEVLLLPEEGNGEDDVEELREMVREVNDTQVLGEEILSYQVYHYDGVRDLLTIA